MPQTNPTQRRVAAVDIGSNTVHMVVIDVDATNQLSVIERRVELVRLGADVTAQGMIGEERAARAEATLRAMAARAAELGASTRLGLATEGVRAAGNADAMLARFSTAWGNPIALVNGMEEAALTFWGATSSMQDPALRLGVGDLGGGSCEIVVGTIDKIVYATSLPLGSGGLVDSVRPADPPTAADIARLHALAQERAQPLPTPDPPLDALIAVGGTGTTLARILGMPATIAAPDLARALTLLQSAPAATLAQQTGTDVERLRLMVGGVVAWQTLLARLGSPTIRISERGVREGAIIAWTRAGEGWQAYARATTAGLGK